MEQKGKSNMQPPKNLYKYCGPAAVDSIFAGGTIRFTRFDLLNDPFEGWLAFDYERPRPTRGTWLPPRTTEAMTHALLSTTVGVLCLTEDPSKLLMWAHYGDGQRGIIIELDTEHEFFNQPFLSRIGIWRDVKGIPGFGSLRRVVYLQERPVNESSESFNLDQLFTKSTEWSDEHEWRMFMPMRDQDADEEDRRRWGIYPFPPEIVTSVIVGAGAAKGTKQVLKNFGEQAPWRHVRFYFAKRDPKEYKVNVEGFTP